MKQANNTEMDRLLQRHARRSLAAPPAGRSEANSESGDGAPEATAPGVHLDADEMSAYAEGALPAAARSRYMAHLADCDSCRRLVTDLALAANVAAEESGRTATPGVPSSKSWWSALLALFAPPVLRYAVPALLLLGIIVVALIATREQRETQFVARNEEKQAGGVTSTPAATEPSVQTTPGELSGVANTSTPATAPNANQPGEATNAPPSDGTLAKSTNANRPSPPSTTTTEPSGAAKPSSPQGENLNDQLYENVPKAAPAPPAEPPQSVAKEEREEEKAARKQNEVTTSGRTETAGVTRNKDAQTRDNSSAAGGSAIEQTEAPQTGARAARSRRSTPSSADKGADRDENLSSSTETRKVGGRKFRRQGNAWVDTAYNSSRSTINVARGSEQYRALVADEPTIRSIADQLGGEVIIVWKGKAYRIY
jgi:Putative zinc-finger